MNMRNILLFAAAGALAFVSSCKKEFDSPPVKTIPVGNVITIDSLKGIYDAQNQNIHIDQDYSIYGVITADETSGNLYKNIYFQDATGAINLRLLTSGGVYQGDSIRLYLKDCVIGKYNGMYQVDSVNTDNNIIKQATGKVIVPEIVTISQVNTSSNLQAKLVKINDVQFIAADAGIPYANAATQQSANRTIEDCGGNMVILRNSGYANFAGSLTATGKGSVIAIVGDYNGTKQLYIRSINDVEMSGPRCGGASLPYMSKNFEDASATSGGWTIQNVNGSINWSTNSMSSQFGSYYGQCSNYVSGTKYACETWLISPSVDLTSSTAPKFSFENACNYTGAAMQVYVSTDYVSGAPSTGTWTLLSPALSSGGWAWTNSGAIDFSAYKTANVHVAFKYTGTTSDGKTWEIDQILIQE